jgi:inhibitor of cysteine peptidase
LADLTLTSAENGQVVPVTIGDTIAVELAENPTTGYQWQIERTGSGVAMVSETFDLQKPPRIGSGGTKRFVFRAAEVGLARIRLRYWQAFSGEASIEDRFEASFEISG